MRGTDGATPVMLLTVTYSSPPTAALARAIYPRPRYAEVTLMRGPPDDEHEVIFVKWITLRNGRRLYAAEKGLRAFRIRVRPRTKR